MTSSGQAETFTLSTALRRAMHVKYVGEEMGMRMPRVITVYVDATVAISFAADVGNPTGMKFIDLREAWVLELRDKCKCRAIKVATLLNPADFGTKFLTAAEFKRQRSYYLYTPKKPIKMAEAGISMMASMTDKPMMDIKGLDGSSLYSVLYA